MPPLDEEISAVYEEITMHNVPLSELHSATSEPSVLRERWGSEGSMSDVNEKNETPRTPTSLGIHSSESSTGDECCAIEFLIRLRTAGSHEACCTAGAWRFPATISYMRGKLLAKWAGKAPPKATRQSVGRV
jgi:hypothetical protein